MNDDEFKPENDTALCPHCEEEFWLPEDTEICPICGSPDLTFVF
jgi:RNA polymerase subunit RPABC4/transcription elongation factor Spt4